MGCKIFFGADSSIRECEVLVSSRGEASDAFVMLGPGLPRGPSMLPFVALTVLSASLLGEAVASSSSSSSSSSVKKKLS